MTATTTIWIVAAVSTLGVILRPLNWPAAIWAVAGATLLVGLGMISPGDAVVGVAKGLDVYLFLIGMMLLSEIARQEGLFDWLASMATRSANGSAGRLFLLVYAVGVIVTIFLSNDATAVVLTPAIAASVKAAKAEEPLPYLLVCAFIANAASFVLPISNPANLVIYGAHMPSLLEWLPRYALPSVLSIVATYTALRWTQRQSLRQKLTTEIAVAPLSSGAMAAAYGIVATAVTLLAASAFDVQLGLPTAIAGLTTTVIVLTIARSSPLGILRDISWGVLPLVAGLFVLVEALDKTGLIGMLASGLRDTMHNSEALTVWGSGIGVALVGNLVNNLPAGLVAGNVVGVADASNRVRSAALIGIDLGPNLSVTGSLATILWLTALRREGYDVSAVTFLKIGCLVMPPALLLTIGAAWMMP